MKLLKKTLDNTGSNSKNHFWLFAFVLFALSGLMIFLYQPLCEGHDFFFHYQRLQALMDGIKLNPYLIYLDYNAIDGYGYFTKAFYSDVILIPFAIIGNFTGLSFAYQSMIFTMTLFCGIFTYLFVNTVYKNTYAASLSAILYTFGSYRLFDIYHRAAIGEALSFTFLPIVALGMYYIIKGDYRKWYIFTIGCSLMIFTHVLSTILLSLIIVIVIFTCYRSFINDRKRIKYLIISVLASFVIVAYYLYPMIEQMLSNTFYYQSRELMSKAKDMTLKPHWIVWGLFTGLVQPRQLAVPGVGILLTLGIMVRLFIYQKSQLLKATDMGVILGLFFIFASSTLFPWSVFPFNKLGFIQMPWRLFEFSSFFFAIAGGYYITLLITNNKRRLVNGILLLFLTSFVFLNDSELYKDTRCREDNCIDQKADLSNAYHLGGLEYIPSKVPSIEFIAERKNTVAVSDSMIRIININKKNSVTSLDINTQKEGKIELPLIYYKGYTAVLNNKKIDVEESDNGLVQLPVNISGHIEVYYGGTDVQKISWFISVIGILSLIVYIFMLKKKVKTNIVK